MLTSSVSLPPLIRLTIDIHGISKIERLDQRPGYDGLNMKELAYVLERREDLSNTYVEFKVCKVTLSSSLAFLISIRATFHACVYLKTNGVCVFGIRAVLLACLLANSSILRL